MTVQPKNIADSSSWLSCVASSGDAGRSWAEEYQRPEHAELEQMSLRSLSALRLGQLSDGKEILDRLADRLRRIETMRPSIRHVHHRWYYGVLAFHEYCVSKLEAADRALQRAHREICAAIEEEPFLVLLANHCQEFRLHQARIARSRLRWHEVRKYVEEAWHMTEGRLPLCVLSDGTPIYLSHMKRFYDSLPVDGRDQSLSELFDETIYRGLFERFVQRLYVLPGFVIPYSRIDERTP